MTFTATANATAIVLAGRRGGQSDPLAVEAGVDLKALVPILNEPLIAHVLRALLASRHVVRVVGCNGDRLREHLPRDVLMSGKRVVYVPAAFDLVDSVRDAAEGAAFPLLITTADNVLLSRDTVDAFIAQAAEAAAAGAAVAFARKAAVLAAHPAGQRKFYSFADGEFSNCNLYWIGGLPALDAVETFRTGGQFLKFPLRIAQAFGFANLIRFRLGIGSLDGFFARLSDRFGFPLRPIELSDGACAIDVDNQRSYDAALALLQQRNRPALAA